MVRTKDHNVTFCKDPGRVSTRDGTPLVKECMERGLLINCTAGNILRFMPPLIVTEKEIDHLIDILEQIFDRLS